MDKLLIITIVEAIYMVYMYNYFKTTSTFHNPLEKMLNNQVFSDFFKHPMYSSEYGSKICPFGNYMGFILGFWVILRYILNRYPPSLSSKIRIINKIIFIAVLLGSMLLNFNSFVYYLPIFIYELYL